jgi:hypothetical protein
MQSTGQAWALHSSVVMRVGQMTPAHFEGVMMERVLVMEPVPQA